MEDERRRTSEDYEQLDRILLGAEEALEKEDLRGTNEALKNANVKAASMWGEVGQPTLPGHTRRLIGLIWEVQEDLGRAEPNHAVGLRNNLHELRSWFEIEARRDAENVKL